MTDYFSIARSLAVSLGLNGLLLILHVGALTVIASRLSQIQINSARVTYPEQNDVCVCVCT